MANAHEITPGKVRKEGETLGESLFSLEDPNSLEPSYLVEQAFGDYLKRKVEAAGTKINSIYTQLKEGGFSERSPLEFNDVDNHAFYITDKDRKVFVMREQSANWIVIGKDADYDFELHIRRFWNRLTPEREKENNQDKNMKRGFRRQVMAADGIVELYSDNLQGNPHVHRPDLAWFKKKEFSLDYKEPFHWTRWNSYGDCRDAGYVLTLKGYKFDGQMHYQDDLKEGIFTFPLIRSAFFQLDLVNGELQERASAKK